MKNFTFLALVSCMLLTAFSAGAQKQRTPQPQVTKQAQQIQEVLKRCGTMEAIEKRLQTDPAYRANYEKGLRDFERSKLNPAINNSTSRVSVLTGPVIIPVVVHVVLPNPNVITDADIQYFIDRLNRDFSGFNADSANGAPFYNVRGHSFLRFAMARRDPGGNLTNGVERRVGTGTFAAGLPEPIKSFATGGLNPWDFTQYYNIWVGQGAGGVIGIAPEIGVGTAANDGVCVDYRTFAANACYTIPSFNLGRTVVHEIGHNFGLYHPFQGACSDMDYQQLTTPSMLLPDALLSVSDDTPAINAPTNGCPAGAAAAGCATSPNPPGRMYQNYMDYTDDVCYSMFSIGQVNRMHYVLENFRPGYLTTQGHIPPTSAITLDAMPLESVNPGGSELIGCTSVSYPSTVNCPGPFVPKFRFKNNGLTVITSLKVGYRHNGAPPVEQTLTGLNLPTGGTMVVTFPTMSLVNGANQFKYYTADPVNGSADQNPANDTLIANLSIASSALPVAEGFEGTGFPPAPWSVINVNAIGAFQWSKRPPGNGSANSIFIQNYDNPEGAIDDFRTGRINVNPTDVVSIEFDVAHRQYPGYSDELQVLVSGDCGLTFTQVFTKAGAALATGTTTTASYVPASAADWRREAITIPSALVSGGNILVSFRSISGFSNNIFIDNINIQGLVGRDLTITSIIQPAGDQCSPTFTPRVVVRNNGTETITGYSINYSVDGVSAGTAVGTGVPLAPGASTTVTLPAYTSTVGPHTFAATVTNVTAASGTGDQNTTNDSRSGSFRVLSLITANLAEGFETSTTMPPAGWTLFNPNNNNTWLRRSPGKASPFSAFIDNFTNDFTGQRDELRSPAISTVGFDSLVITFDLAHKNYPGFNDQLAVIASTDCGLTWQLTSYNRSGSALATAGSSTADYVNPAATDWKTQRVAIGGSFMSTGSVLIGFRNTAGYGNNIFIDNINTAKIYKRDIQLVSIDSVKNVYCATTTVTPRVTIKNIGVETITGFKAAYTIDGGAPQTATITGISLAGGAQASYALPSFTTTLGNHILRAYTFDPVTAGGTGDMQTSNDSLTKMYGQTGEATPPVVEGFEGAQFAPNNWASTNPDNSNSWARANVGRKSTGSAFMKNFGYVKGQVDDLYSPTIRYSGVDSVRLSFDLSATTGIYPGSTRAALDTLEVLLTRDCGNTFTSIYKKWGEDLQTVNDPNFAVNRSFAPEADNQWRKENIDLTAFANGPAYQVVFRNTSSGGNNIYVDNVNFTTRTLPAKLKQNGYLILPTVFNSQFQIWHYLTPTALRFVTVHSASGQQVYKKEFNGNGERLITVDLSSQPAGTYIVSLGYEDQYRNVSERVIKR